MAYKVAAQTGAWSAAATWNSVTNTPTLHASTNVAIDGTARFTATFTAPNTTNACTGVVLYINAVGSAGTVTVTLQESTVDTAAARTLNITDLVAGTWVYFRFASAYTFTTTSAGAYRFKVQASGAAGTTNAAQASSGATYAYLATDDRTGAPGTTDDLFICGPNQSALTVTVDSSQTIGSKTDTVLAIQRTLGNAISLNNLGVLAWDTTADATLTCGGNIICNSGGGELQMGTVASPMPAARLARLRFDMAVAGNHGLRIFAAGKLTLQGTPKSSTTLWKAKLVSGIGTAASPLVVDSAVDWSVGDEIAISATSDNATNYNETEYRFIITKNSATSYVLSATSGGAEAAFAHTHTTDAWVLNVQRNVLLDSTDSSRPFYIYIGSTVDGDINIDWSRFDIIGTSIANKQGFTLAIGTGTTGYGSVDYSVISRYNVGLRLANPRNALSFTGIVAINQQSPNTGDGIHFLTSANNKTLTDCFVFGGQGSGFQLDTAYSATITRCYGIACNRAGSTSAGGFAFSGGGSHTLLSCETHANRNLGVYFSNVSDTVFNSFLSGTKGNNVVDVVNNLAGAYNTVLFLASYFGSTTLISNYLNLLSGSEIAFHAYNGNDNNHTWYTPTGAARSSGSGLTDTTTRTAGSLAVRIAPEDSTTGFVWQFLIGVSANSAASVFGFIQKNAAFGTDLVTVELFLPGSTTADDSQTMGNTTGSWLVFNLAASYTGNVAAFARVRITAKTTTPGAYIYVADLYNGTNVLTSFKAWNEGKPAPVFTELLGDAAAVWAILQETQTTEDTMGYGLAQLFDLIDVASSTRASQASVDTVDGVVDGVAAAVTALNNLSAQQVWEYADRTLSAFGFSVTISEAQAQAIADQVLRRSVTNVQDEAERDNLAQLILATFESSISGTAWTIRKTGGTTFETKTVTLDAEAVPVAGVS